MTFSLIDLRALLRDDDEVVFTDDTLDVAIKASPNSILRAAGIAVRSLAIEYAILDKSITTDDLAIDLRQRGKDLNAVADSFFTDAVNAERAAANEAIQIVPFGGRPYSEHISDRWVNHWW